MGRTDPLVVREQPCSDSGFKRMAGQDPGTPITGVFIGGGFCWGVNCSCCPGTSLRGSGAGLCVQAFQSVVFSPDVLCGCLPGASVSVYQALGAWASPGTTHSSGRNRRALFSDCKGNLLKLRVVFRGAFGNVNRPETENLLSL